MSGFSFSLYTGSWDNQWLFHFPQNHYERPFWGLSTEGPREGPSAGSYPLAFDRSFAHQLHRVWNPNPTRKGLSTFAGSHNAACRTTGGQVRQSTFRKKSGWSLQAHFKPIRLKLKASELADEGTCQWAVWGKTCFLRVHCGERDLEECRERESVGVLWHVWFINSFSNEYSKTSSQFLGRSVLILKTRFYIIWMFFLSLFNMISIWKSIYIKFYGWLIRISWRKITRSWK